MAVFRIFLTSFFVLVLTGCGTVENTDRGPAEKTTRSNDAMLKSSSAARPSWVDSAGTIKNKGAFLFVGRSSGIKTESEAVSMATDDAFSKLSSYFGVSVKSEFISSEQETDGRYTYSIGLQSRITGSKVTVKDYVISGSYTEQWQRNSREFDAFVLLSVPEKEIARIRIEVEGAATCVVVSNHDEVKNKTKEIMQVISKKKSIKFKPEIKSVAKESDEIMSLEKHQTAFLLTVTCEIGKTNEYNGEYYTEIKTTVELISLLDRKVVERWSSVAKGGAFSKEDSIAKGIQESFSEIFSKI